MIYRRYLIVFFASMLVLGSLFVGAILLVKALNDRLIVRDGWKSEGTSLIQTRRLLDRLRHSEATLVFGTSRSNRLSAELLSEPALNLYWVYGNPKMVSQVLSGLDPEQWANIRRIFMLADYHTLGLERYNVDIDGLFAPIDPLVWAQGAITGLSLSDVKSLFTGLFRYAFDHGLHYTDRNGVLVPTESGHWGGAVPSAAVNKSQNPDDIKFDAAPFLTKIQDLADDHKTPVLFVTPVMSAAFARAMLPFMREYLESINRSVRQFYLFTVVPEISNDLSSFTDESHLSGRGMQAWMDLDWDDYLVTKNTFRQKAAALLELLKAAPAQDQNGE